MILRSSYTQSVFSVYPIYTEDIIERYLIKSVNVSSGRAGKAGRIGKAGTSGTDGTGGTGETHGQRSETGGTGETGGRTGTSWEGWEDWDGWDGWDECNGRVLIKILAIEKKILPLLKVKNIAE